MVYLLKMVMFHGYVKSPEGNGLAASEIHWWNPNRTTRAAPGQATTKHQRSFLVPPGSKSSTGAGLHGIRRADAERCWMMLGPLGFTMVYQQKLWILKHTTTCRYCDPWEFKWIHWNSVDVELGFVMVSILYIYTHNMYIVSFFG